MLGTTNFMTSPNLELFFVAAATEISKEKELKQRYPKNTCIMVSRYMRGIAVAKVGQA